MKNMFPVDMTSTIVLFRSKSPYLYMIQELSITGARVCRFTEEKYIFKSDLLITGPNIHYLRNNTHDFNNHIIKKFLDDLGHSFKSDTLNHTRSRTHLISATRRWS